MSIANINNNSYILNNIQDQSNVVSDNKVVNTDGIEDGSTIGKDALGFIDSIQNTQAGIIEKMSKVDTSNPMSVLGIQSELTKLNSTFYVVNSVVKMLPRQINELTKPQ